MSVPGAPEGSSRWSLVGGTESSPPRPLLPLPTPLPRSLSHLPSCPGVLHPSPTGAWCGLQDSKVRPGELPQLTPHLLPSLRAQVWWRSALAPADQIGAAGTSVGEGQSLSDTVSAGLGRPHAVKLRGVALTTRIVWPWGTREGSWGEEVCS